MTSACGSPGTTGRAALKALHTTITLTLPTPGELDIRT
uniref:Uncharacterized protein n=1 Tax=Anguilla anguilla TaxID=7936 RepID=A0A0E9SVA3_ANGAN